MTEATATRHWCVYAYALAVFVISSVAVTTGNSIASAVAFLASFPLGAVYFVVHLVVFSLLNFDPTANAPGWQAIITNSALVVGQSAAAFAQAAVIASLCRDMFEGRRRRQRGAPASS